MFTLSIQNVEAIDAILRHIRRDFEAMMPPHRTKVLLKMILNMNHLEFNTKTVPPDVWDINGNIK